MVEHSPKILASEEIAFKTTTTYKLQSKWMDAELLVCELEKGIFIESCNEAFLECENLKTLQTWCAAKEFWGILNFFVPTFSHLINMTNAQMFVFVKHYLCLLF